MGADDVRLICYFNGTLIDEDRDAKYEGGIRKGDKVPKSIGFASFKEKIREIMNLPINGMEFKIKCGLRLDESTVIGIDVDDEKSLRFVMDDSTFVRAYIQHVPHGTTSNAAQREEMLFPFRAISNGACNENHENEAIPPEVKCDDICGAEAIRLKDRMDSSQLIVEDLVPVEMNMTGLKSPYNDGMSTNKDASPTENELREWFPGKLVPLITGCENPVGDGNCGFRALCMALRRNENEWDLMRKELVKEMELNKDFYRMLFGIEDTCTLLERTKPLEGSAPPANWMDMPSTGFVFAQAFKVVLVHYSKKYCCTFVPFFSPPNADNVKVLGIGLVKNSHYIKLDFRDGCPLPPLPHVPSNWRTICPVIANRWEGLLKSRLHAFTMMNISELQFDKCLVPIVLDEEDQVPLSAPIEDVNKHTSGAIINCLEDTHHRFSQSNVDSQDEGTNYLIGNPEHDEDNEVNMQADMLNGENQLTSQMEETAPISGYIQTSERESARVGSGDTVFDVEREFKDIEAFKNSFSDWALEEGHEYRPARKTPYMLIMKCRSGRCDWYIRVNQLPNSSTFRVVKYQDKHSCLGSQRGCGGGDHRQATIKWILSKMQSSIEKNPEMEPMKIVNEIKKQFGIKISYNKAVKAKTKVIGGMRCCEPLHMLVKELELWENVGKVGISSDGSQHLFWAFRACIDALGNHLRPVVYVGKVDTEIGVLMYARGVDGNSCHKGGVIDVGFAHCVRDDVETWEAFLGWLKEFVLPPTSAEAEAGNSNNNNTIPFAIVTDFRESAVTRAVETVLPHLHHFFDPGSFADVFLKKFNDYNLHALCGEACETFSLEKCESALEEMNSKNKEAYEWLESVGSKCQWAPAFSPNKHVVAVDWEFNSYHLKSMVLKKNKMSIVEIVESSREWVARYFSQRRIDGELMRTTTTGLTPRVKFDLQYVRGYYEYSYENKMSIVEIVKSSRGFVADNFEQRRSRDELMSTTRTGLTPGVTVEFDNARTYDLARYKVKESINGHNKYYYQVTSNSADKDTTWVVDLEERSCTCGEFQTTEYPCQHAFVVIAHLELDIKDYVSHTWYSLDTYIATYAGSLPPPICLDISQWQTAKRRVGRPKKRAKN